MFASIVIVEEVPNTKRLSCQKISAKDVIQNVDDHKEESLRLQNIFAKRVKAEENYDRPIFPKSDIARCSISIHNTLDTNFIFSDLDEKDKAHIFDAFEKVEVPKDECIIKEGDVADYFYIIETGRVEFYVKGLKVNSGEAGSSFGHLALIYNSPRTATCISREACVLWRLDQQTYRAILAKNAMDDENMKRNLIKKVEFLRSANSTDINKIASAATTVHVSKGETIIQKGDISGDFFIIHKGRVAIKDIEDGNKEYEDQCLGPNEYFGELSFMRNKPRTATVIALEDVVLLSISQDVFARAVGSLRDMIIRANDLRRLVSS